MIFVGEDVIIDVCVGNDILNKVVARNSKNNTYQPLITYHNPDYYELLCDSTDPIYRLYGKITPNEWCRLKPSSYFSSATNLEELSTIVGINLQHVSYADINLKGCNKLETIIFNDEVYYSYGTSCFARTNLKSIVLPPGKIETKSSSMQLFTQCPELISVDMSNVDILDDPYCHGVYFSNCSKLESVIFKEPINVMNANTTFNIIFAGCSSLREIDFTKLFYTGSGSIAPYIFNCFKDCTSLEWVDMSSIKSIWGSGNTGGRNFPFMNCPNLRYVKCTQATYKVLFDGRNTMLGVPENVFKDVEWDIV